MAWSAWVVVSGECDLKSTISFDYLTSSDKVLIINYEGSDSIESVDAQSWRWCQIVCCRRWPLHKSLLWLKCHIIICALIYGQWCHWCCFCMLHAATQQQEAKDTPTPTNNKTSCGGRDAMVINNSNRWECHSSDIPSYWLVSYHHEVPLPPRPLPHRPTATNQCPAALDHDSPFPSFIARFYALTSLIILAPSRNRIGVHNWDHRRRFRRRGRLIHHLLRSHA